MRIGPEHWRTVTPDTAGVPTGGRWGNPGWFGRRLKQAGLTLCWSRLHGDFGIIRHVGAGKWTWQMHCRKGGPGSDPIPLGGELLKFVLSLWNEAKNQTADDMMRQIRQAEAEHRQRQQEEQNRYLAGAMPEAVDYMELARGHRSARIIVPLSSMGKPVGLRRDFHARQRARVRTRRRAILTQGDN